MRRRACLSLPPAWSLPILYPLGRRRRAVYGICTSSMQHLLYLLLKFLIVSSTGQSHTTYTPKNVMPTWLPFRVILLQYLGGGPTSSRGVQQQSLRLYYSILQYIKPSQKFIRLLNLPVRTFLGNKLRRYAETLLISQIQLSMYSLTKVAFPSLAYIFIDQPFYLPSRTSHTPHLD